MAATDGKPGAREGGMGALLQAALALPILAVCAKAGAAEVGEIGIATLGYKERGLMRVIEPVLWGRAQIADVWEVQGSAAVDIITGASPQLVSNVSGRPVQTITGASVVDHRTTGDLKVTRRFGDFALGLSHAQSNEEDYRSKAYGLEGRLELDQKRTTLTAGYGRSDDHVGSSIDATLDQPRRTNEYLLGATQVLSPLAVVQSSLALSRGKGWYNDPYKLTLTLYPDALPILASDRRPDHRNSVTWLTRLRRHFPQASGTLQADYRYFRDDWGIRAHTLEVAWQQDLSERWALRPALRYYTQGAADFYSPVVPRPQPAILSSDQRLGAFGGLSPSLRVTARLPGGLVVEATAGYVLDARSLRMGGGGSEAFETLRAAYGLVSVSRTF